MTQRSTYKSYLKSLLWLALSVALAAGAANITQLVIIDFIHGNLNRPISNAITMMWLFTFIFGIIAIFGIFLVFSISQFTQATVARISEGLRYQSSIVIASIPFVSIVTWYCWEYLTPTDFNLGINAGVD